MYAKGTTLLLDFGTFNHYGIADGCGGVIHNSKKYFMVTHESEADLQKEKIYWSVILQVIILGMPTTGQKDVLAWAMIYLNQTVNTLFGYVMVLKLKALKYKNIYYLVDPGALHCHSLTHNPSLSPFQH